MLTKCCEAMTLVVMVLDLDPAGWISDCAYEMLRGHEKFLLISEPWLEPFHPKATTSDSFLTKQWEK